MMRPPTPVEFDEVRPTQRAANDDRQSVGQVLQQMQRKPSRAPYMGAFFLSGAWIVLGIMSAAAYFGGDFSQVTRPGSYPVLLALASPASCCRCCCST